MRHLLALPIRIYRLFSAGLSPRCRFHPSCSQYALDTLEKHGAFGGLWRTCWRLARCHPFHPGGYDPA